MGTFALVLLVAALPGKSQDAAPSLLEKSVSAMGGERLTSIRTLHLRANAVRNMVEQSIRPEGPWIADMYVMDLVLDFPNGRVSELAMRRGGLLELGEPDENPQPMQFVTGNDVAAMRMGDDALVPAPRSQLQDASEWLAFNPLRVLATAAAAPDLHAENDVIRHGVPQKVLAWSQREGRVRLFVDATSYLPSAVEWTSPRPADIFWGAWGDIRTELSFENWTLLEDGLRVPMQWTFVRNGLPDKTLQLFSFARETGLDDPSWNFDAALREAFEKAPKDIDSIPFGRQNQPPVELPGGSVLVPGRWNVTFVHQREGIVMIEAPISSGYSAKALDAAERFFPGVPVKAVVSTSDAWPHIAGLREYAARGIPIYLLDLNRPIVERLLGSTRTSHEDTLAKTPRQALLREVTAPMSLGDGDDRIELVPLRTPTGERQMLVALPGRGVMYTSDLIQPQGDGKWYSTETRLELSQRLKTLGRSPQTCFGMHYAPVWCSSLLDGLPGVGQPSGHEN